MYTGIAPYLIGDCSYPRGHDRRILEGPLPQLIDLGGRERVDAEVDVDQERAREDDAEVDEENRSLGAALLEVGDGLEVLGEVAAVLLALLALLETAEPLDDPQVHRDGRPHAGLWKGT